MTDEVLDEATHDDLRGAPTAANPIELSYQDLGRLPSESYAASVECDVTVVRHPVTVV